MDLLSALLTGHFQPIPGKNRIGYGKRAGKLRLTREESRRRSLAGERERERFNRETAKKFIEACPARLAEWKRRQRAA